tara:strand:- start:92 stop:883 length:792 start_codon:yes stop_codon:yes gene_type:complete
MNTNKSKIESFFDSYAKEYSLENYDITKNKVMILRLKTIVSFVVKSFPNKNINILDLGCGSGEIAESLAVLNYTGDAIDNSPKMIEICKKKLAKYKWNIFLKDAEKTKFDKKKYDLIIASGLIEYYTNDHILLNEISRLLKKNGKLIINVTNKYGYSTSLNKISYYFKQNFLFKYIKKRIFKLNYGVVNFKARKHNIKKFKKLLFDYNYSIEKERYIGFSLFPSPFMTLFNAFTKKIDLKLEKLSNTPLKYFGASYIVLCKKN